MSYDDAIRRVLQGETSAYEAVVAGCHPAVCAFVARFFPDRHRIDEIAQRAFIWSFEHLGEYTIGTNFAAWLKGITRTLLLSELEQIERESRNRKNYLLYLETARARQDLATPDDTESRMVALRECLESIPVPSREMIDEHYRRRLPLDQLARSRGTSEGAIKMALLRARQSLRRCIEGKLGRPQTLEASHEA